MPIIAGRASAAYGSGFGAVTTVPYAGPFGAYDSLATVTVPSGGLANILFAGIPAGYKHLQIRGQVLSSSANNGIAARFNGDSSANYSLHGIDASGAGSPTAYGSANTQNLNIGYTGDATYPSTFICDILDYSNVTKSKTVRAISGNNANSTGTRYVTVISGRYSPLTEITSILLYHGGSVNFNEHSQFALYGVK